MTETIDEDVGVVTLYDPKRRVPLPCLIKWRGQRYVIKKVDLHHTLWEGRTLHHIYSLCDGTTFFRLDFNTRSLQWRLTEVSDGLAS